MRKIEKYVIIKAFRVPIQFDFQWLSDSEWGSYVRSLVAWTKKHYLSILKIKRGNHSCVIIENKNMKSFMRYNCKNMLLIDCNSNPKGIAGFRNIRLSQRVRGVTAREIRIQTSRMGNARALNRWGNALAKYEIKLVICNVLSNFV